MFSLGCGDSTGVAWFAHVGGFAAGVVGMLLWKRLVEDARPAGRLGDTVG